MSRSIGHINSIFLPYSLFHALFLALYFGKDAPGCVYMQEAKRSCHENRSYILTDVHMSILCFLTIRIEDRGGEDKVIPSGRNKSEIWRRERGQKSWLSCTEHIIFPRMRHGYLHCVCRNTSTVHVNSTVRQGGWKSNYAGGEKLISSFSIFVFRPYRTSNCVCSTMSEWY